MIFRDRTSKSITEPENKTSQEDIFSLLSQFLPALKESSSSLISTANIHHPPTHSSSFKFDNHPKEDLSLELSPLSESSPILNTGSVGNYAIVVCMHNLHRIVRVRFPMTLQTTRLSISLTKEWTLIRIRYQKITDSIDVDRNRTPRSKVLSATSLVGIRRQDNSTY